MRTRRDGSRRRRRASAAAATIVVLASCGGGERPVSDDAPAAAPEPVMRAVSGTAGITEAEIAQIALAVNSVDASFAELARSRSEHPEMVRFANTLLADHNALNAELRRLAAQLGLDAPQHAMIAQMQQEAADARAALDSLAGPAFDAAYLRREAVFHEGVLAALDETLIRGARSAQLRTFLENMRPTIEAHYHRARQLIAAPPARRAAEPPRLPTGSTP
jgi:putative membrane protein